MQIERNKTNGMVVLKNTKGKVLFEVPLLEYYDIRDAILNSYAGELLESFVDKNNICVDEMTEQDVKYNPEIFGRVSRELGKRIKLSVPPGMIEEVITSCMESFVRERKYPDYKTCVFVLKDTSGDENRYVFFSITEGTLSEFLFEEQLTRDVFEAKSDEYMRKLYLYATTNEKILMAEAVDSDIIPVCTSRK